MRLPGRYCLPLTLVSALILIVPLSSRADDSRCPQAVARVASIQGPVEARLGDATAPWRPVRLESRLCAGDTIRVQANGRAAIELRNQTVVRLDQHTTLTLGVVEVERASWLELIKGAVHFITRTPRSLEIRTPYVNAAVEGTEFQLRVTDTETRLWVYEGRVLASNSAGSQRLASGQSLTARAGTAPEINLTLTPQDAVRWTLYYPVVVDFRPDEFAGGDAAGWQRSTSESLAALDAGNAADALNRVLAVDQAVPDARFYTYRASLLLSVGRVDEAGEDLRRARERDANSSAALAIEAIVALAQNDKVRAHDLAQRAVAAGANSTAALLALSYTQQARFELDKALASARRAQTAGTSPTADVRVAELLLSVGEVSKAVDAARAAAGRSPRAARAQAVLGFASLANMRTGRARGAFEQALALDSADPLARLGSGLARIRDGDLEAGRREIEIAAALDPSNALVRSYLGKAYFEERRDRVAADQFAMAKQLDPKDPTPWLYDALRKQSLGRPVEALQDLQTSIELNDNRAVYRSRLQLDQDLGVRSAGLARVYADLGFEQLALAQARASLIIDPTNHSAHRLLSDAYAGIERHDIARVSELLQAQLFQPLNINPVQPQSADGGLALLRGAGPAELPVDEFNALFERDRTALRLTAMGGDHDTGADEVIVSGIQGPLSYSIGQFRYDTDGTRINNDARQDMYNAFLQLALGHRSSLQGEYRLTRVDRGDISQSYVPSNFSTTERTEIDLESYRLGLRLAPNARTDLLASVIYLEKAEEVTESFFSIEQNPRAYQVELQAVNRYDSLRMIYGLGHYLEETDDIFLFFGFPPPDVTDFDIKHSTAYLYNYWTSAPGLTWTLGASYDSYQFQTLDREQFNPKLGMAWEISPATTLRAAVFRVIKRAILADQSIEPTQVAGFNQQVDAFSGTDTRTYGVGLDHKFGPALWGGVEAGYHDIASLITSPTIRDNLQDETTYQSYLYWTPVRSLAVGVELQGSRYDRVSDGNTSKPLKLDTDRVPLSVKYFFTNGLSVGITPTYVRQAVDFFLTGGGINAQSDTFWVVDGSVSYRLPSRAGVISLLVQNLHDKELQFQDMNFRSGAKRIADYQPERRVFARITLSF